VVTSRNVRGEQIIIDRAFTIGIVGVACCTLRPHRLQK